MCLGESSQFVSVIIIKTQNRQEKNQSKTAQTQHPTVQPVGFGMT
jgi:hypothetical protein